LFAAANISAEVKVTLPLLRDMPKLPDSSGSTPKSTSSLPREADETVTLLRARVIGMKVSLCGFDLVTPDPITNNMAKLLKNSVTNFLTSWYGLKVVPLGQKANIIIANEADPVTVSKLVRQGTTNRKPPTVLVLCSHSSRFDRAVSGNAAHGNVGFVAKPVGPIKLARALTSCLEGAPPTSTPNFPDPSSASSQNESSDLSNVFEELSLSPNGGEMLDNSRMAADSDNARKAIESPTPNASTEKHEEFPFPVKEDRPAPPTHHSAPTDKLSLAPLNSGQAPARASAAFTDMENASKTGTSKQIGSVAVTSPSPALPAQAPPSSLKSPRLLLVDDNKINLTLLRTYMRKRKYSIVDEAENGLDAVNKFASRDDGYDIIFMDISMPVLDGFGATRQIRAVEENRRKKLLESNPKVGKGGEQEKTPALVIALTGLASSRDQSEAFSCGIDLFLTKPVAFKEVGKMLDNWEANRERDSRSGSASLQSGETLKDAGGG
jgi:CheY-like chemotaxis protein